MKLTEFKNALKKQYGINVKNVTVNSPLENDRVVWTEIKWKDVPSLVKMTGQRRECVVARFVARLHKNRGDKNVYVTELETFNPITTPNLRYVAYQYAAGKISRMPFWPKQYGAKSHNGCDATELERYPDRYETALNDAIGLSNVKYCVAGVLSADKMWTMIVNDAEIAGLRQRSLAAREAVNAANMCASVVREDCDGYVGDSSERMSALFDMCMRQARVECDGLGLV